MYYFILNFFVYGIVGWCVEVAFAACKEKRFVNRGFLNGPICPIYGIGVGMVVQFLTPYKENLLLLYVTSIVLVTALEWVTGFVLEKIFHHKWWDYSNMPLNVNGYVCLLFSLIWGVACVLVVDFIHPVIHKGLSLLPHWFGMTLIVVLGVVLLADLYVTSSKILKMNKHLKEMEEIAEELHRISDELGENIYRGMVQVMERHDELKEKMEDVSEEIKDRMQDMSGDIKDRVQDMSGDIKDRVQDMSGGIKDRVQDMSGDIKDKMQDMSDDIKDKMEDVSEGMSERAEMLKKRYRELGMRESRFSGRILKAFPRIESKRYREAMEDLKKYLKRK